MMNFNLVILDAERLKKHLRQERHKDEIHDIQLADKKTKGTIDSSSHR
jgi:hypothetical protein